MILGLQPAYSFAHDFDSDLYLLSKDPGAKSWKVIVHGKDGRKHSRSLEKFSPYPGCATHDGEAAWLVECFQPEKIEIQVPGQQAIFIKHPDREK